MPLVHCPFCGSRNLAVEHLGDHEHPFFVVTCRECEADGPIKPTAAEAMDAWNTRRSHDGDGN